MALPKLKSIAAGVFAAGLALAPMAPIQEARADNAGAPTAQTVSTQQKAKVAVSDARGAGERAVQMAAAMESRSSQVIVFYGENQAALASTWDAAQSAIAQGLPVKGIVRADPLTPKTVNGVHISGANQIEFYADGDLTATIDNPGPTVGKLVLENLMADYKEFILPRRSLAMNTAPSSP